MIKLITTPEKNNDEYNYITFVIIRDVHELKNGRVYIIIAQS